ncbi:filaggrin-like isoform X3 [Daphnia pulex]|uniref:filaggrin-like isoform X3 n=1 Tax=Daphnia pulex TaxID=6669 RepID=UPI001EDE7106|nr:filaggrin-like isoform X3 [Daphnia pulex]
MNQLGTVYATKRRRRNGKSLKPSPKESSGKSNPSKRHRERLNAELDTLASLLPYEASILSKLDRLSILRLSVSYLRTKSYFQVSCHKGIKGEQQQQQHSQHGGGGHFLLHDNQFRNRDVTIFDSPSLDGESFLQALNGFLLILTSDGEVFFATHTIESYLGFHQSDVVHQSVYELVHSEDREELQRQLTWSSQLPADSGLTLLDALRPDNSMILERSFTVRFRCLLDNTSGFLRLDIRGRVKVLHGQNRKMEEPPLALFAICTPFGPPSLLELPHKESMFKSKHRLDLALVSMDQRGKALLGHSDAELSSLGGYDLVHFDDLAYVASAHQELLKTGASGLIAYRLQTKDGQFQWLQTSSRLVYKNSKPDFIISTHRPLMEEEGRDLMGKRTMDFKVSYLDAGLTSNYFTDQEAGSAISATVAPTTTTTSTTTGASVTTGQTTVLPSQTGGTNAHPPGTQKIGRKYKNQLRDFLTNCRTKRKSGSSGAASAAANGLTTPPEPSPVHYLSGSSNSGVELASGVAGWTTTTTAGVGGGSAAASSAAASAAVAAAATAYSPSVYPGASAAAAAAAAATVPYHADATNSFYHSAMHHHHHHHQLAAHHHHAAHHQPNATLQNLQNLHQSFYGTPGALDHNRFGIVPTAEHNLFHHGHAAYARGLGVGVGAAGYYAAEYSPYVHAAAATTNGFLAAGYDSTIGGMSQLYGGSSNSSPAGGGGGGGGGAGSPAAGDVSKYATTSTSSVSASSGGGGTAAGGGVSSLGRLTTSLHHHHHHGGGGGGGLGGGGLLSSGETEPSSESSGTSTSSIAGGDSPYNNGHHNNNTNNHHHQQQQQQQQQRNNNLSSRPSSRKPVDQQQQQQQQQMMQQLQQQQQQQQQLSKADKYGGDGRDSSNGGASSGGSSSGGGYPGDCGVSETGIKTKYAGHHGVYNGHHQQQQQQQQQQHHHVQQQQQQQQHDVTVSKPVVVSSNGVANSNNNLDNSNSSSLNSACKWGRVGPHYLYGAAASAADVVSGSSEVSWPPHHHHHHHHPTAPHHHHHHPHQYYPYPYHHAHHHHHQSPHHSASSTTTNTALDQPAVHHPFTNNNNNNTNHHHHHLHSTTASIVPAVQDQHQQQHNNNNTIPVANHSNSSSNSSTSSFAAAAGSGDRIGVARTAVLCCPSPR